MAHLCAAQGTVTADMAGSLRGINASSLEYCKGEFKCRFVDRHVLVRSDLDQSQIFISTRVTESEQERVCDDDAETCRRSSPFQTTKVVEFLPVGVEDMQVVISHEVEAPNSYARTRNDFFHSGSKSAEGRIVSYRDDGTGRVRLVTLEEVEPTRGLRMTVAELLSYAGLDLDKPVPGWVDTDAGTTLRETGAQIMCRVRYINDYNKVLNPVVPKYEFECVPARQQASGISSNYEVVGFGGERMMVKRTGLRVVFVIEGEFASVSLVRIFVTLCITAFLLQLASWCIIQIATRFLSVSERYEAAKYEYTENVYNLRQSINTFQDQVIEGTATVEERLEGLLGALPVRPRRAGTGIGTYGAVATGDQDMRDVAAGDSGVQRPPPMYPAR